jgi:hypothetical protein
MFNSESVNESLILLALFVKDNKIDTNLARE